MKNLPSLLQWHNSVVGAQAPATATQQFTHPHIISLHVNSFSRAWALFCHCWLLHTLLSCATSEEEDGTTHQHWGEIGNWRRRWSWDCIFNYFPLEHFKGSSFQREWDGIERKKKFLHLRAGGELLSVKFIRIQRERDDGGNLISFRPIIPSENCRSSARELESSCQVGELERWTQNKVERRRRKKERRDPSTPQWEKRNFLLIFLFYF